MMVKGYTTEQVGLLMMVVPVTMGLVCAKRFGHAELTVSVRSGDQSDRADISADSVTWS